MILTTTNTIEGFKIIEYKGIVTGLSINYQKGTFTFNMTKYYEAIESEVETIKEDAFQKIRENALKLKANAIVGITVDLETSAAGSTIVSVTGTAVTVA